MIELLILACITIVALLATLAYAIRSHARHSAHLAEIHRQDQQLWRDERRFLVDRAIARHIGEVVALEREDTRKNEHPSMHDGERQPRPLLEGLS